VHIGATPPYTGV